MPDAVGNFTFNGLTIRYTITGQGPPMLLVHGHASSQDLWVKKKLPMLDKYCRYTLDLPGHAGSDKPPLEWFSLENYTNLLAQFCRRFHLRDLVVVAHSMGGLLCLSLALTHPELVSRLILIAPVIEGSFLAYLDFLLPWEKIICQPWSQLMLDLYNFYPWLAAPIAANWYADPRMLLTDSFRQAQADFARCPLTTLFGNFKLVRQADLRPHLSRLQIPTLIIAGEQDRVVPCSQSRLLAHLAPHTELVLIPRCGHLPFDEQPELFAAAIAMSTVSS
ncbi:MAG: alpha/beta hydrolase [Anaerolineae bacterium]|nr:alpha/beta hydrolase [Anaerolineae bacterium]